MNDYDNYVTWLKDHNIAESLIVNYANTIRNMLKFGISEKEILYGNVIDTVDEYVKRANKHYAVKTLSLQRYILRKYRQFRGVEE